MRKVTYKICYKYQDQPWIVYDSTTVKNWMQIQWDRMVREHPGAKHELRKER